MIVKLDDYREKPKPPTPTLEQVLGAIVTRLDRLEASHNALVEIVVEEYRTEDGQ